MKCRLSDGNYNVYVYAMQTKGLNTRCTQDMGSEQKSKTFCCCCVGVCLWPHTTHQQQKTATATATTDPPGKEKEYSTFGKHTMWQTE